LRKGFERYTFRDENLQDSILQEKIESVSKPYTRFTAACFLVIGVGASFVVGLLIGYVLESSVASSMPRIFTASLRPEFIFYPPIVVLCVDLMHSLAARFDRA
jgi:hypothetical protein